jgi:hypothetical protein
MLVEMKIDIDGVNDGDVYPTSYTAGQVVEIGPDLYRAFSGIGAIEKSDPDYILEIETEEEKQIEPEYETKIIEPKKTTKKRGGSK